MDVLHCAGMRKRFDDLVAVDDVGFTIAQGETYGLLGPNGAGKTTSISMIAGILEPDAGLDPGDVEGHGLAVTCTVPTGGGR